MENQSLKSNGVLTIGDLYHVRRGLTFYALPDGQTLDSYILKLAHLNATRPVVVRDPVTGWFPTGQKLSLFQVGGFPHVLPTDTLLYLGSFDFVPRNSQLHFFHTDRGILFSTHEKLSVFIPGIKKPCKGKKKKK